VLAELAEDGAHLEVKLALVAELLELEAEETVSVGCLLVALESREGLTSRDHGHVTRVVTDKGRGRVMGGCFNYLLVARHSIQGLLFLVIYSGLKK
jgi:hypothetical protein